MSIKKSLSIAASLFLMASGLDAAANPVVEVTKLLTAVRANNYDSSVAVAARAEFIKLNPGQINRILETPELAALFTTPYGFSLIHGWMLNKFTPHDLPFYINSKFSFDAYFRGMVDEIIYQSRPLAHNTPDRLSLAAQLVKWKKFGEAFSQLLLSKWGAAKASIEPNRWAYYEQMQYMQAAIVQAGAASTNSSFIRQSSAMPAIIRSSFEKMPSGKVSAMNTPSKSEIAATRGSDLGSSYVPETPKSPITWGEWWSGSKKVPASENKYDRGNNHLVDNFPEDSKTPVKSKASDDSRALHSPSSTSGIPSRTSTNRELFPKIAPHSTPPVPEKH